MNIFGYLWIGFLICSVIGIIIWLNSGKDYRKEAMKGIEETHKYVPKTKNNGYVGGGCEFYSGSSSYDSFYDVSSPSCPYGMWNC